MHKPRAAYASAGRNTASASERDFVREVVFRGLGLRRSERQFLRRPNPNARYRFALYLGRGRIDFDAGAGPSISFVVANNVGDAVEVHPVQRQALLGVLEVDDDLILLAAIALQRLERRGRDLEHARLVGQV